MKKYVAMILFLFLLLSASNAYAGITGTLKIKTIGHHDVSEIVVNDGVVISGYHGDPENPTKYAIVGGSYDGNKLVVMYQKRSDKDITYDWFSSMWIFRRHGNTFKVFRILNNNGSVLNSYTHDFEILNDSTK